MRSSLLILCSAVVLGGARLGAQAPTQAPAQAPTTTPAVTNAQPTGGRRGGHGGMQRMLLNGIALSAAQRAQLKTIQTRYRDERRAARGTGVAAGDTATRHRGRAMREQQLSDIRGVLTPDQQSTFDRNVSAMRAQQRQRHANATGTTR